MDRSTFTFIIVSLVFIAAALYQAVVSFRSRRVELNRLATGTVFGVFAVVFYMGRLFIESSGAFMVWTSLCLISVAVAMFYFARFSVHFTCLSENKWARLLLRCFSLGLVLDAVIWVVNPFYPWAIGLESVPERMFLSVSDKNAFYVFHLALVFTMFATSIGLMLFRYAREPKVYRKRYIGPSIIVAVLLLINVLLDEFTNLKLDYSIEFYCLLPVCVYWYSCRFAVIDLINYFNDNIFKNIDRGVVLFDYKGVLIIHNKMAEQLLPGINLNNPLTQKEFLKLCNISDSYSQSTEVYSTQGFVNRDDKIQPIRCDFRKIKGKGDCPVGNLFVISDTVARTDLLTGFHSWEHFKNFVANDTSLFTYPLTVVVCDLNNLSRLNNMKGHNAGDRLLIGMADAMRETFPQGSCFVRGEDAKLIVICDYMELAEVNERMEIVKKKVKANFQYAVDGATTWNTNIVDAIDSATHTLMQKKLLDRSSARSELLTSLVRALQECDSDTEAHVKRTQRMGAALGRQIGLSDKQQSNLSLLCLLHDIGKIGIPLDILNKPGKLSDEEWNTIKTHAKKGYEIAKSSKGLVEIADMILHHHERWDGHGYPDGLKGEQIPLLSRIIAVVDSFDAMVSNRSYRAARPIQEAIAELERCAGTQFDPYLVSEFVAICHDVAKDVKPDEDKFDPIFDDIISRSKKNGDENNKSLHHVHNVMFTRYFLDIHNAIIEVDENFEKMTGFTMDDVRAKSLRQMDLIPEEDLTEYICLVSEVLAKNPMLYCEHRLKRKDGTVIYVFCIGKVFYDSVSRETRSEIIVTNSSNTYAMMMMKGEAKDAAAARMKLLENPSTKDVLTGLLNSETFRRDAEEKITYGKYRVMALAVDVDGYEKFCESKDRDAGEDLLLLISEALNDSLRDHDMACRLGKDRFVAMLFFEKDASPSQMYDRAQQIYDKVSVTVSLEADAPTLSMGAALDSNQVKTYDELINAAEKLMKTSKKRGGGRLIVSE